MNPISELLFQLKMNGHRDWTNMESVLDELPMGAAIFFDLTKSFIVNKTGLHYLGASSVGELENRKLFDSGEIKKINLSIEKAKKTGEILNQKIVIRRLNDVDTTTIIKYNIKYIKEKDYFLILFFESVEELDSNLVSVHYTLKNELVKLSPYLNDYGKGLLNEMLKKMNVDDVTLSNHHNVFFENDVLHRISKEYPILSQAEVVLSGLYALRMTSADIASMLNKSTNAVHVNTYRILKKLNLNQREELIDKMSEFMNITNTT